MFDYDEPQWLRDAPDYTPDPPDPDPDPDWQAPEGYAPDPPDADEIAAMQAFAYAMELSQQFIDDLRAVTDWL